MSAIDKVKNSYSYHYDKFNILREELLINDPYYCAQLNILKEINIHDKKVLDIGTGNARIVRFCKELGARNIDSVEIDPILWKRAYEFFENDKCISIYNDDILNFFDRYKKNYDIIICFDVIEHLHRDEGLLLLEKVFLHLTDGGICIFRTENMANILIGAYSHYMDFTHQVGYTEFSLAQLFHQTGFSNIKVVNPKFRRWSKLWLFYKISSFIQKILIFIQDRKIPTCLHKDLVIIGEKNVSAVS